MASIILQRPVLVLSSNSISLLLPISWIFVMLTVLSHCFASIFLNSHHSIIQWFVDRLDLGGRLSHRTRVISLRDRRHLETNGLLCQDTAHQGGPSEEVDSLKN
jgi:hypothetical protein